MDNGPHFKSEPPAPQVDPASKPAFTHAHSDETERPPSAQQIHDDEEKHVEEVVEDEDEDDGMELDLDPAEGIADFDWDALHERYHQAMDACHDQESDLSQEWTSLMNYFRIWADSGNEHETDRTFKRLKTRTGYVQHSENKLDQTREHYTQVVKAFESALNLLTNMGFRA